MKDSKTYNGWTNYETWAVHLWITNEQAPYFHWKDRAWEILGDQTKYEDDATGEAVQLANEIREAITDECTIATACLASDLMTAALEKVDWIEIAQAFVEDATPPKSNRPGLFSLGKILATPGALEKVPHEERVEALARHARGDWGDTGPEDWAENELSLKEGFRLFSVYHTGSKLKFWIITEADRSVTTILLPEEY